ncbi:MAG: hypothetical protein AAF492_00050 [Verrucomicrobiota bacterium]
MEAKILNVYRSNVFPALVGDFILRYRNAGPKVACLLAILLSRFSEKAIRDIKRYMDVYMPELNWLVMDEEGNGCTHVDQVEESFVVERLKQGVTGERPRSSPGGLFSENNQWLLKILLLAGIGKQYWGGPKELPQSISQLVVASGVSQSSVSSFIAKFESAGYLQRGPRGFRIHRHRELLNDWFHAIKYNRVSPQPLQSLYGDELKEDVLLASIREYEDKKGENKGQSLAISHHLGCHLLGAGRSNVRMGWLLIRESSEHVLSSLNLAPSPSAVSNYYVVNISVSRSILPGAIMENGVPVCDVLKCYLDVRSSAARGHEQAEFLYERILHPHFSGGA